MVLMPMKTTAKICGERDIRCYPRLPLRFRVQGLLPSDIKNNEDTSVYIYPVLNYCSSKREQVGRVKSLLPLFTFNFPTLEF